MELRTIEAADAPTPLAFYSQGVVWGTTAYLAGQIASDYRTGVPDEARRSLRLRDGSDIAAQTRYVLRNLEAVARAAGTDLPRVVRAQAFLKRAADFDAFDGVWAEVFGADPPPRTTVVVGGHGLLVPGTLVEIDLWAASTDRQPENVGRGAVPALGAYPPARRLGPLIHCAGRMALATDGSISPDARVPDTFPFYGEPTHRQAGKVLDEFAELLGSWGGDLGDVVQARIYVTDLEDLDLLEEVCVDRFPTPPARTIVAPGALLADGARLEIELIAVDPAHRDAVRYVRAPWAPEGAPSGVVVGDTVLLSGVTAGDVDPPDGSPYLVHPVTRQTEAVVDRLRGCLHAAGTDLDHLVKTQVFLRDLDDFHRYDRAWKRRLTRLPPRTTVQSGPQGFLDPRALVSVDAVAVVP